MASTGIGQPVENGKLVDNTASGNTESTNKNKKNSSLDKEAFLQLLVAQMKYQDPLEPTSNTEYISQLATFSSLEEMQNLNKTMTEMQGSNLVGKQVVMKVINAVTGATTYVSGNVDYAMRENGKTFLFIDGNPYNIEDLESVVDESYLDAISLAQTFKDAISALPSKDEVTLDDKEKIEAAKEAVNAMTGYQQSFLDSESLTKLKELLEKLAELEAAAGGGEDDEGKTEGDGETGGTDTDNTSGGE